MKRGRRGLTVFRALAALFCLLLALFPLSGCKSRTTSIEYVIGVSLANVSEQWRLVLKNELEQEAARHEGVRLVMMDAAGDSKKQASDVERLMGFDVDLLIISPCDVEALTPVISEAYTQIPVIVLDRAMEGYDYSLFIGPDNKLIGRQAGDAVLDLLEEKGAKNGTVLELKTDSFSSKSRSNEFFNTLADSGVRLKSIYLNEATRDCAEDILLAHPEVLEGIDVIFAHNDYMAYGAYLAMEKLQIDGVKLVGLDGFSGENSGLQMVEQGVIDATVTCPTGGAEAIQYAIDIIDKRSGIPKQVILRSHQIRRDNVHGFQRSYQYPDAENRLIRVGYAQIAEESLWRQVSTESIEEAAEEFGIDLTLALNEPSVEAQIAQVRKFIEQKMDVIAVSPVVQEGWQEVLEEARKAQIPVLLVDRMVSVDEEWYDSFIGAEFEEEGRRCARWVMQETELWQEVRIMELRGTDGASPVQKRKAGFEEAVADDDRYRIVFSECGDFNEEGGRQIVSDYLASHKWDIDVIFAHNDNMALGAVEALKEQGLKPGTDVKIVSIDGTSEGLEALKNGEMNCIVECNPLLGPQLMKAVTDLVQGKELPLRIITDEMVFDETTPQEAFRNRKY